VFWFLDQYRRPGSSQHPGFALSVHYHISGKLDVMAITTAVDQLVQRDEALRIKVQLAASEGTQNSARADPLSVTRVPDDYPDAALRPQRMNTQRPLDPSTGCVLPPTSPPLRIPSTS